LQKNRCDSGQDNIHGNLPNAQLAVWRNGGSNPLFFKILYLTACKPIKNATFAAVNIFKESNHAKQK